MMYGLGAWTPLEKTAQDLEDLQKQLDQLTRKAGSIHQAPPDLVMILGGCGLDLLTLPARQDQLETRVAERLWAVFIVMLVYSLRNTECSAEYFLMRGFIVSVVGLIGTRTVGYLMRPSTPMMEATCCHFNQLRDHLQRLNGTAPLGVGRLSESAPGEGTCIQTRCRLKTG